MNEPLMAAAERGDTSEILRLLAVGAEINMRDSRGRTALMAATHGNHIAAVQTLLESGADVDIQDDRKDNPFLYSGAEGLLEILKLTYAAGADTRLTNRYGGSALIPAAHHGHVETVREILTQTNVNVNHINNLGWTALLEAIILSDGGVRHQQIVQLLVDHGADITVPDKEGVTPLEHARQRNYAVITKILADAGTR